MWNFIVTICVNLALLVCVIVSGVMYGRTILTMCDNKYYGYVKDIRQLNTGNNKVQILQLQIYTQKFEFKETYELASKNINITKGNTIPIYKDCQLNPKSGYQSTPFIIHSNTMWQPILAYSVTAFIISIIFLIAMCTAARCSRDIIILDPLDSQTMV